MFETDEPWNPNTEASVCCLQIEIDTVKEVWNAYIVLQYLLDISMFSYKVEVTQCHKFSNFGGQNINF